MIKKIDKRWRKREFGMDYKLYYRKFRNGTILVITLVLISKAPRLLTLFPFAMCLAKVHLAYETTIWTYKIPVTHLLQTLHLSISNCFAKTPSFTKQKNLQQSMSTKSVGNFWVAHVKSISVSHIVSSFWHLVSKSFWISLSVLSNAELERFSINRCIKIWQSIKNRKCILATF